MQGGSLLDRLRRALTGRAAAAEDPRGAEALAARGPAERSEKLRLRTEVLRAQLDRAGRRNEALTGRLRALSRGGPEAGSGDDLEALRARLGEAERERDELAAQHARAEQIQAMLTDLGPLTLDELDHRMAARLDAIEMRLAALRSGP